MTTNSLTPITTTDAKVRPAERVLVSIDEAAALLGMGGSTLFNALRSGEIDLPVIMHFGRQRIARSDIDAYVAQLPRRVGRRVVVPASAKEPRGGRGSAA